MCDFISALKHENKYYFLTSDKLDTFLRSKKGREWKKTHGTNDDDVKGHGFLEEFIYPELKGKSAHWECTDFSSQKNFPDEIVKQLKLGNLRFVLPPLPEQLLIGPAEAQYQEICGPAYAQYQKICGPAEAQYQKIRGQAYAQYQEIRGPAYAQYQEICGPAYAQYQEIRGQAEAQYQEIRGQAEAQYQEIRGPAYAQYQKIRGQAYAQYQKIRGDLFWNLFMVKKNRAKAWK